MKTITLDLKKMYNQASLHQYLKTELSLPAYYGANLDALYDCLTDINEETQLIIPAAVGSSEYLGWYGKQFLQVLQDAAVHNAKLQLVIE